MRSSARKQCCASIELPRPSNASRFSCGRRARRSEFYGPLSASGGSRRAEPEAPRACQLQPLVRQLAAKAGSGLSSAFFPGPQR